MYICVININIQYFITDFDIWNHWITITHEQMIFELILKLYRHFCLLGLIHNLEFGRLIHHFHKSLSSFKKCVDWVCFIYTITNIDFIYDDNNMIKLGSHNLQWLSVSWRLVCWAPLTLWTPVFGSRGTLST